MKNSSEKLKVIIVEDHPIFRKGLGLLIDQTEAYTLVGEAESVAEAMEVIKETSPDIIILDIGLKDSNGLDLIKNIQSYYKKIKILVVSMYEEELYAVRVLRAGAHGYIMKKQASTNTVDALDQIIRGEFYLSPEIRNKLVISSACGSPVNNDAALHSLTDREFQVFTRIGKGLGVREIAEELNLSRKTVETHRDRIKTKLNLESAAELRKFAINWFQSNPSS